MHYQLITLGARTACPSLRLTAACPASQVLQVNDNAIESLDGVTNLPRLQELFLCNNRILCSGCLSDSGQGEVPHWEGTDSEQGGCPDEGLGEGALAV